jgi:hypothetical protein
MEEVFYYGTLGIMFVGFCFLALPLLAILAAWLGKIKFRL